VNDQPVNAPPVNLLPPMRPTIAGLDDSLIRRIANEAMHRSDVIPLWFGEPDVPTPAFINDAAKAALDAGHTFYAQNRGVPELIAALATYMSGLYRPIAEDRVTVTASGMNGIMLTMQALVDPGDNVVVTTPLWPNCAETVHVMGGEARKVALGLDEHGWRLDLDRLIDAMDERTKAVFLNSPNNPTGWTMHEDDMRALYATCMARGIYVIADEVYNRIVYDAPRAPSFLDFAEPDDRVIVVNSFSKSWLMTGWRLGWLTHPPAIGETFAMLNEYNLAAPTTFVQHAGITAIEQGEPLIAEIVARYRTNRDLVYQRLAALPRVKISRPEGAFYAFFGVEGVDDSFEFAKEIVAQTGVGLAPGRAFGDAGESYLRLCFAARTPTLSEAMDRLVPALG